MPARPVEWRLLRTAQTIDDATGLPVLVGSGVRTDNVARILEIASGVIIGSSLKRGGVRWNAVETAKVAEFMRETRRARGE